MHYLTIIEHLRFRDILDILFLSIVVYYLYIWFRGTKALKALIGLAALGIIYTAARFWGLFLTTWVFQILWQVLVIMLIILFQSEIRQVLERVNPLQNIGLHPYTKSTGWIPDFVEGIFSLAKRRIGALVIVERMDRVREWVTAGFPLNAEPGPEMLLSLFQRESPLHDGAALIRGDHLVLAACYLPLSSAEGLPKEWGTRHRAAMGLSERCDAWVVVVSEERGVVSLARNGQMVRVESPDQLHQLMEEAAAPPAPKYGSWPERLKGLLTNRWPIKVGTLSLVAVTWLLLAGQQNFQISLRVPLEVKNLPEQLEVQPMNPEIEVTVQGLRKDVGTLNERNVQAEINAPAVREGKRTYTLSQEQIHLPQGQFHIVDIEPQRLEFTFKKKPPGKSEE